MSGSRKLDSLLLQVAGEEPSDEEEEDAAAGVKTISSKKKKTKKNNKSSSNTKGNTNNNENRMLELWEPIYKTFKRLRGIAHVNMYLYQLIPIPECSYDMVDALLTQAQLQMPSNTTTSSTANTTTQSLLGPRLAPLISLIWTTVLTGEELYKGYSPYSPNFTGAVPLLPEWKRVFQQAFLQHQQQEGENDTTPSTSTTPIDIPNVALVVQALQKTARIVRAMARPMVAPLPSSSSSSPKSSRARGRRAAVKISHRHDASRVVTYTDDPAMPLLHFLTWNQLPPTILYLAALVFPQQVRTRDAWGNLPIHYANLSAVEWNKWWKGGGGGGGGGDYSKNVPQSPQRDQMASPLLDYSDLLILQQEPIVAKTPTNNKPQEQPPESTEGASSQNKATTTTGTPAATRTFGGENQEAAVPKGSATSPTVAVAAAVAAAAAARPILATTTTTTTSTSTTRTFAHHQLWVTKKKPPTRRLGNVAQSILEQRGFTDSDSDDDDDSDSDSDDEDALKRPYYPYAGNSSIFSSPRPRTTTKRTTSTTTTPPPPSFPQGATLARILQHETAVPLLLALYPRGAAKPCRAGRLPLQSYLLSFLDFRRQHIGKNTKQQQPLTIYYPPTPYGNNNNNNGNNTSRNQPDPNFQAWRFVQQDVQQLLTLYPPAIAAVDPQLGCEAVLLPPMALTARILATLEKENEKEQQQQKQGDRGNNNTENPTNNPNPNGGPPPAPPPGLVDPALYQHVGQDGLLVEDDDYEDDQEEDDDQTSNWRNSHYARRHFFLYGHFPPGDPYHARDPSSLLSSSMALGSSSSTTSTRDPVFDLAMVSLTYQLLKSRPQALNKRGASDGKEEEDDDSALWNLRERHLHRRWKQKVAALERVQTENEQLEARLAQLVLLEQQTKKKQPQQRRVVDSNEAEAEDGDDKQDHQDVPPASSTPDSGGKGPSKKRRGKKEKAPHEPASSPSSLRGKPRSTKRKHPLLEEESPAPTTTPASSSAKHKRAKRVHVVVTSKRKLVQARK
jgi:hypothetical protein